MKKIKIFSLITIFFLMVSCSKNELGSLQKNNYDNGPLHFRQITDVETIKKRIADSYINNDTTTSSTIKRQLIKTNQIVDSLKFDLNNLVIATQDGVDGSAILAPATTNTYNSYTGIAYYQSKDSIVNTLIVRSNLKSDSIAEVTYFNSDMEPLQSFIVNCKEGLFTVNSDKIDKVQGFYPNSIQSIKKIKGQAVADCITDAYSNHGWVSVALIVESAFIWQTTVGIAIGCAIKNR
jgi:hypothetical protein